jgi:hypothetical protein
MNDDTPAYEFITDYRVYFRYKLREYIMNIMNPRQIFEDYIDDILVMTVNPRGTETNIERYALNVYLINSKDGKLSKVREEGTGLVVELYKI